jgi:hypothetical protein
VDFFSSCVADIDVLKSAYYSRVEMLFKSRKHTLRSTRHNKRQFQQRSTTAASGRAEQNKRQSVTSAAATSLVAVTSNGELTTSAASCNQERQRSSSSSPAAADVTGGETSVGYGNLASTSSSDVTAVRKGQQHQGMGLLMVRKHSGSCPVSRAGMVPRPGRGTISAICKFFVVVLIAQYFRYDPSVTVSNSYIHVLKISYL